MKKSWWKIFQSNKMIWKKKPMLYKKNINKIVLYIGVIIQKRDSVFIWLIAKLKYYYTKKPRVVK